MPLSYVDNDVTRILTSARINALLAARERKTWNGAKNATRRPDGRAVRLLLEELEQKLGYNIITPDSRKGTSVILTREGEELADHCAVIHLQLAAIYKASKSRMITVVGLPHHDQLILPLEARVPQELQVNEVFLDEHQRSSFEDDAILPLLHGAYDVVIGLPPADDKDAASKLNSVTIYEPQLQVMVPFYPTARESVSLEELATEHRLLVPSPEFRSRKLLDDSMKRSGIDIAANPGRIRLESHMTKNLVRYGWHEKGTVVLPSDIAAPWKADGECAGVQAKNFRWVPVLHQGAPLTHKVNATMRVDDDRVEPVFSTLLQVAEELRGKLEGQA